MSVVMLRIDTSFLTTVLDRGWYGGTVQDVIFLVPVIGRSSHFLQLASTASAAITVVLLLALFTSQACEQNVGLVAIRLNRCHSGIGLTWKHCSNHTETAPLHCLHHSAMKH